MEDEQLLLAEYEHFTESFWKNEELGERRVNFFISLTTAIIAGVVALVTGTGAELDALRPAIAAALGGVYLYGIVTFLRILRRDQVADEYKDIVDYLREELRRRSPGLSGYRLPFLPREARRRRGSLAESVIVMNSLLLSATALLLFSGGSGWLVAPIAFLLSAVPQLAVAWQRGHSAAPSPPPAPAPAARGQTFRAGAGAVILNPEGQVLALERRDVPGAWQLPQGGLDTDEEPLAGAKREIKEETGLNAGALRLLRPDPLLLAYELPERYRNHKRGRGQVLYWYFFRFDGDEEAITLGDGKEFGDWRWTSIAELAATVVPFRRRVYQALARELASPAP